MDCLAAVASAGASADFARFEQHDIEAAFAQLDRRRQPRQPAADDRHIAHSRIALKCVEALRARRRGGVVRVARQVAVGIEQGHKRYALGSFLGEA